jgi:hypothetical protein
MAIAEKIGIGSALNKEKQAMRRIEGIIVSMGIGLVGCGTTQPMQPAQPQVVYVQQPTAPAPLNQEYNAQAAVKDAPKWVRLMGCDPVGVPDSKGKVCGVGSHLIESPRRMNLARDLAQAAGTKKISMTMAQKVQSKLRLFEAEISAEQGGPSNAGTNSENLGAQVFEQVSKLSIYGVRCADTWVGPDNNFYALMIADPDSVKTALTQMRGLSEQMQATIVRHAAEMVEELKAETAQPAPGQVQ